jgi:Ca-activated chloride channel family protein
MLNRTLSRHLAILACSIALPLSLVPPAFAQDVQDEEEAEDYSEVIVTGTRIRQGGAQDIQHFRSMALSTDTLPRPESLTMEGLMGEHDLTLAGDGNCDQLFCLVTKAMPAALPTRPDDVLFVGLGFESNIDGDAWRREPLSLMAVVDRSGSMSGQPIETVKAALRAVVDRMEKGDRLGIAIYGTTSLVHLQPTAVVGNKEKLIEAINAIAIDGSTNMEAGLKIGYDAAFAEAEAFRGKTRMMLFTDERPNTGRTDSAGFMAMATEASRRGIGLTTIGVGVQYDGALATKISSVRGGNLFFLTNPTDGREIITKEFRNMVSEVAHDVTITMTPMAGYSVSGVFGVPDGLMTQGKDGSLSVTVPTAFLSSNGGGIYASLAKSSDRKFLPAASVNEETPLMNISLSYVSALDGKMGTDWLAVAAPNDDEAPKQLKLAHSLVDQYLSMNAATRAFHEKGDAKAAFALLEGLDRRMQGSGLAELDSERELVGTMRSKAALFAGYSGEVPTDLRPMMVLGKWRVVSLSGVEDLSRGDLMEFTDDEEVITYFRRPLRGDDEMYQDFQINERQIYIPDGDLRMNYRVRGDRLTMFTLDGTVKIELRREAADAEVIS